MSPVPGMGWDRMHMARTTWPVFRICRRKRIRWMGVKGWGEVVFKINTLNQSMIIIK